MIRFLLKLSVAFTLLFAVCIALIRAQPYDDSELRAFLTPPEGCPAPCFMGIRPGVTTVEDAQVILSGHPWISIVEKESDSGVTWITGIWSGQQPDFVRTDRMGKIEISGLITGTVQTIHVDTNIRLGELFLTIGDPDESWFSPGGILYHYVSYAGFSLTGNGFVPCPPQHSDLWSVHLVLEWGSPYRTIYQVDVTESGHAFPEYSPDFWFSIFAWCM